MAPVPPPGLLQTVPELPGLGPDEFVNYWPDILSLVWFLAGFVVILFVGWYVVEPAISRAIRRRNRKNPTIQEAISRYVRLLVVVTALLVAVTISGYGGFVTDSAVVVAAVTLAIGVAGQTVIGSLISGLVLVLDPEFNVGDYIEWEAGEGTVRSITLRVTRVQTPDGELVTIPNAVLTSQSITRPFGRGRYRIVEFVEIAYEDDVDDAIRHLRDAAADVDSIVSVPEPSAHIDHLGDEGVVLRVHYWIEDPRRRDIVTTKSAYAHMAKARLEEAGITISPASQRELQGRIDVDSSG